MTKLKLKIELLSDYYDCDTCGSSYSEGARVTLDGVLLLELIPVAHCFGGDNWDEREVFAKILDKLGYDLEME